MMKKALPWTLVFIGTALLIATGVFWIDSSNAIEPLSFGQSLLGWVTLIIGLGASFKGWMDLLKKGRPLSHAQADTEDVAINGGHELQRAKLANRELVRFIAHELNNPMTSIKGYTELLATGSVGPLNEMQINFLSTIRANVERMSEIIANLSDQAELDANHLRLDYKPVYVPDIVNEVVRSTKRQVEDKRQALELRLPPQLPLARTDQIRVGQVLRILVNNAHKYSAEGEKIIVGADVVPNQWDSEGSPQVIHFWVQDNGIGISIEEQSKIFRKFFRSDDPKARESSGSGLGLSIAKSLVEMMGGRIWIESELGKGSTFHFTVPVYEE